MIKESFSYLFREQLKRGPLIIGNALALMTYLKCRDRCESVFKTLSSTQHQHRHADFLSKTTYGFTYETGDGNRLRINQIQVNTNNTNLCVDHSFQSSIQYNRAKVATLFPRLGFIASTHPSVHVKFDITLSVPILYTHFICDQCN